MTTLAASPTTGRAQTAMGTPILEQLASVLANAQRRQEAAGLLRALTRVLLSAVSMMRQENIEPFERGLHYLARQLSVEIRAEELARDPRYLLGRVDAMLDLCAVSIDRSLSSEVLRQARRRHAREILQHLLQYGDTTPTKLAQTIGVRQNHLSNILHWMETVDLVRRVEAGRSTLVSLGPKGEAAHKALAEESASAPSPSTERENRVLGSISPAEVPTGSSESLHRALQELAQSQGMSVYDMVHEAAALEESRAERGEEVRVLVHS